MPCDGYESLASLSGVVTPGPGLDGATGLYPEDTSRVHGLPFKGEPCLSKALLPTPVNRTYRRKYSRYRNDERQIEVRHTGESAFRLDASTDRDGEVCRVPHDGHGSRHPTRRRLAAPSCRLVGLRRND
jgi:hypothetical protein